MSLISLAGRAPLTLLLSLPLLAGSVPGIGNFDQVDNHVYRGGQPNADGFHYLATLGVKTVIDLRETGDRAKQEERVVTAAGMKYLNVPMTGLTAPTESEITRIMAVLEDKTTGPVFVHCLRGADRTGAVIAAYHIDHDKWDNAKALKDAKAHKMSFFQLPRQSFIRDFQPRTVSADAITAATIVPVASTPAPAASGAAGLTN
jgi:protein tyrosine phosphatase (PTP) superfamily phosphohydrolase (DUF442 family)